MRSQLHLPNYCRHFFYPPYAGKEKPHVLWGFPFAQTALRWHQSPYDIPRSETTGNPLKRNVNTVAIATDRVCFRDLYRAENLRYQFKQGQKLLPQFRQIICLVKVGRDTRTRCITIAEDYSLFEAFLYTVCAYSKTNFEPKN